MSGLRVERDSEGVGTSARPWRGLVKGHSDATCPTPREDVGARGEGQKEGLLKTR